MDHKLVLRCFHSCKSMPDTPMTAVCSSEMHVQCDAFCRRQLDNVREASLQQVLDTASDQRLRSLRSRSARSRLKAAVKSDATKKGCQGCTATVCIHTRGLVVRHPRNSKLIHLEIAFTFTERDNAAAPSHK